MHLLLVLMTAIWCQQDALDEVQGGSVLFELRAVLQSEQHFEKKMCKLDIRFAQNV